MGTNERRDPAQDRSEADSEPPPPVPASSDSTFPSSRRRLTDVVHKSARRTAEALTVVAAVWGAATGTMALKQSRDINISFDAATYAGINAIPNSRAIGTDPLRVSIVNTSARSVSVVQAEVLLQGVVVGRVVGVTLDRALDEDGAVSSTPVPLPVTVPADRSFRLVMDWRTLSAERRRLLRTLRLPIARRGFALRLLFDPGDAQQEAVRSGDQPPLIGGWIPMINLRDNRVTHIMMAAAARSSGTTEATLKLWRTDPTVGRPLMILRRPAGWTLPAWFSVSSLAPGSYTYTLSAGDTVVGGGAFRTSCTGSDANYWGSACVNGDASAVKPFDVQFSPPAQQHD